MQLRPDEISALPSKPGVYKFYTSSNQLLYVGKAINLKKRVSSYFQKKVHNIRTQIMINKIYIIKIICTVSEHDALVLENFLIKNHKPRYNVLLRDDKTFPYLFLTKEKFPRLGVTRSTNNKKVKYFGPFTNVRKLKSIVDELQKIFSLRTCNDSYFSNRSRACLFYQIGRCSGPCVGHISEKEYNEKCLQLTRFLEGKYEDIISDYVNEMQRFAKIQAFEKAQHCKNVIDSIQSIVNSKRQSNKNMDKKDVDVIIFKDLGEIFYIQVLFVVNNQVDDTKVFTFENVSGSSMDVLEEFVNRYYQTSTLLLGQSKLILFPGECESYVNVFNKNFEFLPNLRFLSMQSANGFLKRFFEIASVNFSAFLQKNSATKKMKFDDCFVEIKEFFNLNNIYKIECIDISHTQGNSTCASCVVFDKTGPVKNLYRVYNLSTKNDDCASMQEVVKKRYAKLHREDKLPDMLLIDGGKGQINAVKNILLDLKIFNLPLIAITKHSSRLSGLEHYYKWSFNSSVESLKPSGSCCNFFQFMRDQAHDYAIKHHRKRFAKNSLSSSLLSIPGIGPKKYNILILHFGGIDSLKKANLFQLMKVPGISEVIANKILTFIKRD